MKTAALSTILVASVSAQSAPTSSPTYYRALPTGENAFIKTSYTDAKCLTENAVSITMGKKNLCAALSATSAMMYDTTTTPGSITQNMYTDPMTCQTVSSEVWSFKMNDCVADGAGAYLKFTDYDSTNSEMIVVGVFSDFLCRTATATPAYIMSGATDGKCDTVYNSGVPFTSFKTTHTAPPNGVGTVKIFIGSSSTPNTVCAGTPLQISAASGFCTPLTDPTIVAALAGYGCATDACFIEVFPVNALATAGSVTARVSALLLVGVAVVGAALL